LAQTVTGVISGTVVDATKATIPGASVTAVNQETGLKRSTVTNDVGFYEFPSLPPGPYTVTVELTGFKRYEQTDVALTVSQRVRVDAELQLGEITDSITVTGGTIMVDTRSSEISSLVDDKRITDMPLSGRNVISLAGLIPGVTAVSAPQVQTGNRGGPRISVHGGRQNSNYFTLNATYFNSASRNTGFNPPPPDAVREFRIKTNNFSAAEGRNSGAVVSVVTRGGTNEFHGSVWEFHRNDNLNARSFFQAQKGNRIQNQFGVAAGGPVIKDKIFVFGSYEGFRDRPQPSATSAYPPTAAERAGDFSNVATQLVNPYTGAAFAGNQVPTDLFDPVALKLLSFVPLPNQPNGTYQESRPSNTNNNLFMFRNDINISDRQDVFWHFYYNKSETPGRMQGNIPGWMDVDSYAVYKNFGVTHTYTFTPTLLNSFTFGWTPADQLAENQQRHTSADLGMDYPDYTSYGSAQFRVSGRFNLNAGAQDEFSQEAMNFHESMIWTRGEHTFKYGAEFFRLSFYQAWLGPPSFSFNGTRSGNAMVDFMLGAFRSNSVGNGRRMNDTIQPWYWSFYFQDEWRVSPKLTLTLGMRYELPSPWNDKRNIALSSIVLPVDACRESATSVGPSVDLTACGAVTTSAPVTGAPPGYLFANYDLPRGLIEADTNNFAPRLGFAYDLKGDGKTSIRGGFGVFYDTANADTLAQVNPPFANTSSFSNGQLGAPNVGLSVTLPPANPSPDQGGFTTPLSPLSTDLAIRSTYYFHWNLGVQRQLSQDLMLSVDYIGKIGRKGLAFYPFNPALYIPGQSTIDNFDDRVLYGRGIYGAYYNLMLGSMYDAWYHGLDVEVNKRLSDGFSLLTSFTWSKAIDQNSTYNLGGDAPDPFHIKQSEQGLAEQDRRVVFALSAMWEPFALHTGEGALKYLLSGWNFSPIIRLSSGGPLEFYVGDMALDGTGWGQHAWVSANPGKDHSSRDSMITEYFNTSVFSVPEEGQYGNAAKGLIAGPGSALVDLAILKDFPVGLTEESTVQFRAEFFNLFNRPNFGGPDETFYSGTFGRITGAGAGREIQFGLKFLW